MSWHNISPLTSLYGSRPFSAQQCLPGSNLHTLTEILDTPSTGRRYGWTGRRTDPNINRHWVLKAGGDLTNSRDHICSCPHATLQLCNDLLQDLWEGGWGEEGEEGGGGGGGGGRRGRREEEEEEEGEGGEGEGGEGEEGVAVT